MASVGETLRFAREQRGLSIEQVSQDTRISARFLQALEADQFDALPAPVYVRGFIRSYASYLKLDGSALLARLSDAGGPIRETGVRGNGAAETGRRVDPFRREPAAEQVPIDQAATIPGGMRFPEEADRPFDEEISAQETIRRRNPVPGRPLPPPVVPPDALDDIGDDGLVYRHAPMLGEADDSRSPSRIIAFAAIGLLGVAIAVVTGVLLTRGDDDPVAMVVSTESPTRTGGTVVAVTGSQTPEPAATPSSSAAVPGGPSGGTPTGSPTPAGTTTATPTGTDPDETPTEQSDGQEPPTPTAEISVTPTATIAQPTATPTVFSTPTPTPLPTFTPTPVVVQPHPIAYQECFNNDCGPPPLRVICPPDGTWFVDVGKDYPNPGWPSNESAITTAQAREVGEAGC